MKISIVSLIKVLILISLTAGLDVADKVNVSNPVAFSGNADKPHLDRLMTIRTDREFEGLFIGKINDILVQEDKTIYVADASNMRICNFTIEGGFQYCFGRIGRGPGEFENVNNLVFDEDENRLGVYDSKLNRMSWFDAASNKYLYSVILKGMIGDIYLADNNDLIISKYVFNNKGNYVDVLSAAGEKKKSILAVNQETEFNLMSGNTVKIESGKYLYFAYPYPYLISVFDKKDLTELKQITLNKEDFTVPEKASRGPGGAMMGPSMPSRIRDIKLSEDGRLVVEAQTEDDKATIDFFSPTGTYKFSLAQPDEHNLAYYNNDRLITFIRGNRSKMAEIVLWEIKGI